MKQLIFYAVFVIAALATIGLLLEMLFFDGGVVTYIGLLGSSGLTGLIMVWLFVYLVYRFTRHREPEETGKVESPPA